jgi:hypothetical protein
MLSLPIAFTSAIGVFAPVFSRPVWQHVKVLLTGAVLALGKRTVTAILQIMGRSAAPDFQTYHRVLNRAIWSPLTASRLLLRLPTGLARRRCGRLRARPGKACARRAAWGGRATPRRGHQRAQGGRGWADAGGWDCVKSGFVFPIPQARRLATPQMAALRPKAYAPLAPDPARQGEIIAVPVALDAAMARVAVVRQVRQESAGVKLEDATIVVAGGRGLGGPEPFRELQELTGMLGAAMGASRAAVDAGWVPGNWQVGLTGKTITPDLYITVGISGASQHMAGYSGAKVIVAINKDAEANIFREARYGVVGDWHVVVPAFMAAVRSLK